VEGTHGVLAGGARWVIVLGVVVWGGAGKGTVEERCYFAIFMDEVKVGHAETVRREEGQTIRNSTHVMMNERQWQSDSVETREGKPVSMTYQKSNGLQAEAAFGKGGGQKRRSRRFGRGRRRGARCRFRWGRCWRWGRVG